MYLHNLFIEEPKSIELDYFIPEHLKNISSIEEMRRVDLDRLDYELKGKGSSLEEKIDKGIIWRKKFPGMILDIQNIHYNPAKELLLKVVPIHPHRADLAYKNDKTLIKNVSPLTANALLQDRKNNFILGIRGGSVEDGKIGIIPGGHTDYTQPIIEDPLDTLRNEFEEELGFKFDTEENPEILGIFSNSDTKGINILYLTEPTKLTFQEILEKWKTSKDREEHSFLFRASYEDIKRLAQERLINIEGKKYNTTPFFRDCFKYFVYSFSK